ncbi:MAG: SLC13 family permease, partial [Pirellulales bacterium]
MWPAWFTLGVLALVFALLIRSRIAPDVVLIGGVALLLVAGILEPREALSGLANEAMATVGVLFIVGAGVRQTGGVDLVVHRFLGRP